MEQRVEVHWRKSKIEFTMEESLQKGGVEVRGDRTD